MNIENVPATPSTPRGRDYLALAGRHKWLVLFLTTVAVLFTYLFFGLHPPEYEATATLDLQDKAVPSQLHLLHSDTVLRPVSRRYEVQPENLRMEQTPGTSLVRILYRHPDAQRAQDIAGLLAVSYLEALEQSRFAAWEKSSAITDSQIAMARTQMEQSQEESLRFRSPLGERVEREAAYESLRQGSITDFAASEDGDAARKLLDRRMEAQHRLSYLQQLFGESHPEYRQTLHNIAEEDEELASLRHVAIQKAFAQFKEAELHERHWQEDQRLALRMRWSPKQNAPGLPDALRLKAAADRSRYRALVRKAAANRMNARLQEPQVRIVEPVSAGMVNFHPLRHSLFALLTAFPLLSFVVAFGAAEKRLRTVSDVSESGVSVLGLLPHVSAWRESLWQKAEPHIACAAVPGTTETAYREAIERLRDTIAGLDPVPLRSIAVVSPLPQEGRSSLAVNLAICCTEAGQKVLLIDGEPRQPALPKLFPAALPPGLHLLPASASTTEVAAEYDLVLIDSPSFLHNPGAVDLIKQAGAVLIEVRAGHTPEDAYLRLLGYLWRLNAKVLGVVLNAV